MTLAWRQIWNGGGDGGAYRWQIAVGVGAGQKEMTIGAYIEQAKLDAAQSRAQQRARKANQGPVAKELIALITLMLQAPINSFVGILVRLVAIAGVVTCFLLVLSRLLGLSVHNNQISFSRVVENDVQTEVIASQGWQVSSVKVKTGDQLCLKPTGRIHIAANQMVALSGTGKQLAKIYEEPSSEGRQLPVLLDLPKFRWDWVPPGGVNVVDGTLDECKLLAKAPWGSLLLSVFSSEVRSVTTGIEDPSKYPGTEQILKPEAMKVIDRRRGIRAEQDGYLAFTVNDAVLRDDVEPCKQMKNALGRASEALQADPDHRFTVGPLFWYSDNLGAFRVQIERHECVEAP